MSAATDALRILCPGCKQPNLPRAKFCQYCRHDMILNNDGEAAGDGPRYRITRVIKSGGMGAVYEGIDDAGKPYAIKELLDRFEDDKERSEGIQRFMDEARLLQGLRHPRIPQVYAVFRDQGRFYLTMDFVRGRDLEQLLEKSPGGRLPEAQVLEWADQICDVLGYLHSQGLIYRDMKPSNIMIDEINGGIKLVDFGIAKVFHPTERGTQIGTPGYAPPEQYQGMATQASDIYALGATLHHLLTGRDPREQPPFSFQPARNVNPAISRRTSDALEKALQMKPEERFGSVAELRAMLRPLPAARELVRPAPATAALPAVPAQVASGPAQPARAATALPAPAPAARPPAAPARPAVQPRVPTSRPVAAPPPYPRVGFGRFLLSSLIMLVMLLIALGIGAYTLFPGLVQPYLPGFLQPAATTAPVLRTETFETSLDVTVDAGADTDAIYQAFVDAYGARVRQQFGPDARVNPNLPPTIVGAVDCRSQPDGRQFCQATISGVIARP